MINPLPPPVGAPADTSVNNFPELQNVQVQNFPVTQPVNVANEYIQTGSNDGEHLSVGAMTDSAATDSTSAWSIISLLKGLFAKPIGPVSGSVSVTNFPATQNVAVQNFPVVQPVSGTVNVGNIPAVQPVSGTVNVGNIPAVQPVSVTNFPNPQPTREVINTGRQALLLSWEAVPGTTVEALTNFTAGTLGGIGLTSANRYTVSAGKTLRIQSVNVSMGQNGSSAANYRVRIRQAAAVTASSPIVFAAGGGGPSNTCNEISCAIPDGLEIPGGQQIAMTHLDTAAGAVLSVSIVGFEY